jgi:hypothetical protein
MKIIARWIVALAVAFAGAWAAQPALAGDTDPLFINLTTDDSHRANMGISFGRNQLDRGHPRNAAKFAEHQKALDEMMKKGATILICPMCMKHYGVKPDDVLPGLKVGNPELTGAAVFRDNTKSLTW